MKEELKYYDKQQCNFQECSGGFFDDDHPERWVYPCGECRSSPEPVKDEQKSQWREFKAGIVTEDICPGSEPVKDVCPECEGEKSYLISNMDGTEQKEIPCHSCTDKPPVDDVREALGCSISIDEAKNYLNTLIGIDYHRYIKTRLAGDFAVECVVNYLLLEKSNDELQSEINQIKISARDQANTYMTEIEELSTELDEYKLLLKEERLIHSDDKSEIERLKAENEVMQSLIEKCKESDNPWELLFKENN